MARIDEMVLSMDFDNSKFKKGASETLSVLESLKKNLNFDSLKNAFKGPSSDIKNLQNEVNSVDLNSISSQLETMTSQWSVWGTVGRTAIARVTNTVMDLGGKLKGALWDPIVDGGMNRARNLEQANFMLQGIVGGAEDGAQQIELIMDNANEAVTGTAFGLDSAAKAAAQFAATGMRGGEKMTSTLRGIAGVASMTSSEYDEIAQIFTTVSGQGRLMTDQLNQMASRGINAAASLAEHFGVTEGELREMVTKGKVSFDDFAEAMDNAFGEQSQRANETYAGSLSNVRAALARIGAPVATAYLQNMRDVFNALRPAINAVNEALGPFIEILVNRMGRAATNVIGPINNFVSALEQFNATGKASTSAWTGFFGFMQDLGTIIGLVGDVFADAIKVILGGSPRFIEMATTMTSAGDKIYNIVRKVLSVFMLVPEIIGMILQEVFGLSGGVGSLGMSFLNIVDHIASFAYIMAEAVRESKLLQLAIKLIGTVVKIGVGAFALLGRAVSFVVDIFGKLASFMTPVTQGISRLVGAVAEFALKLLDFQFPDFAQITGWVGDLWGILKKFRLPKINLSEFRSFGDLVQATTGWFREMFDTIRNLDFSWFTNLFSGFEGMGGWFSDFKMPDFNTDGIAGLRNSLTDFASGKYNNLKVGGNLDFAFKIRDMGVKAADFVKSIDYRAVAAGIGDNLQNAFRLAIDGLKSFGSWISDIFSDIDWGALGKNVAEGIVSAFNFVKDAAVNIAEFLTEMITSAVEMIDFGAIWDNIKDFGSGIGEAVGDVIGGLKDGFTGDGLDQKVEAEIEVDVKTSGLEEAEKLVSDNSFVGRIKGIAEAIGELFKGIGGVEVDFSVIEDVFGSGLGSAFGTAATSVGSLIKWLVNPIQTAIDNATTAATDGLGTFGTTIADKFSDTMAFVGENIDGKVVSDVLSSLGALFTGLSIFNLSRSISGLTDGLSGIATSVSGFLDGIKDSIASFGEAAKTEARGNFILKIAASLAILAGSMWLMSSLDWNGIAKGLAGLGGAILILIGAAILIDKIDLSETATAGIQALGIALLAMAGSVLVLAAAVKVFSSMDWGELARGIVGTAAAMAILVAAAVFLPEKKLISTSLALGILAGSMILLASSLRMIGALDMAAMGRGLLIMSGALLALSVAARIAAKGNMLQAGLGMMAVAAGALVLYHAMKQFADLEAGAIFKTLGILAAIMLALTVMSAFGNTGGILQIGLAVLSVAAGMVVLQFAMERLGSLDWGQIIKGSAAVLGILVAIGLALKVFPKGEMVQIGTGLMGIAAGMLVMTAAIWLLGSIDLGTLAQGLITFALVLAAVVASVAIMSKVGGDIKGLGTGLALLAAGMLLLGVAVLFLGNQDWKTLGAGLGYLAIGLASVIALGYVAQFAAVGLLSLGGAVLMISAAVLVGAAAFWVFSAALEKLTGFQDQISSTGEALGSFLWNTSGPMAVWAVAGAVFAVTLVLLGASLVVFGVGLLGASVGILAFIGVMNLFISTLERLAAIEFSGIANGIRNLIPGLRDTGEEAGEETVAGFEEGGSGAAAAGEKVGREAADGVANASAEFRGKGEEHSAEYAEGVGTDQGAAAQAETNVMAALEGFGMDPGAFGDIGLGQGESYAAGVGGAQGSSNAAGMMDAQAALEGAGLDPGLFSGVGLGQGEGYASGVAGAQGSASDAGDSLGNAAVTGVGSRAGEMSQKGEEAGRGFSTGLGNMIGVVRDAASKLAGAAVSALSGLLQTNSPSKVTAEIGDWAGEGFALGITRSTHISETAASDMAQGVVDTTKSALEIASPSRVFDRLGQEVGNGFAKGINSGDPVKAIRDTINEMIKITDEATGGLLKSSGGFYDALIDRFNDNPVTKRLEALGRHSEAAYATAVKERRIADAEEVERAEDEKEKIYRDIEDARREIEDSRKSAREAEEQKVDEKHTAEEKARAVSDAKRKIADAEKRERRAVAAKDRYEYHMHGEEAGVQFIDGVAVGIIDNSDKLPTVADIFSEVLLDELDYVRTQADNFIGVFDGLANVRTSFRSITDQARDLRRAIGRLSTATSAKSYRRHMDVIIDTTIGIAKEFVGLMDVFDRFAPYLPDLLSQFDKHLPAIIPMVAQFAPGLADTLGGGLAAALPAIAGPVAGIIGAIAGIGIFLYDMANDQILYQLIRSVFFGIIQFIRELPERLVGLIKTLIRGFVNLITELPSFIGELAVALIDAFVEILVMLPEALPEIIMALVDAFVEILTVLPVALIENAGKILVALTNAFRVIAEDLILKLPSIFIKVGSALVDGILRGIVGGVTGLLKAVVAMFTSVVDVVKALLGIRSPSRVFAGIGENIMEGMSEGIDGKAGGIKDSIKTAIDDMLRSIEDGPDGVLTLTPVIDTEEATKDLDALSRIMSGASIDTSSNYDSAASVSRIRSEEEVLEGASESAAPVTNINYTQNNTSPRPLSAIEIYRNTQKQLELMD